MFDHGLCDHMSIPDLFMEFLICVYKYLAVKF